MFLCCYVVKLGKAQKTKNRKNNIPKKWTCFRVFFKTSYGWVCKVIVFLLVCFVVFALLLPKHYKNSSFDDLEKLILVFWVKITRSITWPPQGQ